MSANTQKNRSGFNRVVHAFLISLAGLHSAMTEKAFKQECYLALLLIPSAFWLGKNWLEIALLISLVMLVLIVELLNTGVESVVDRVGSEWHELSKRAKDTGSAAVLLSLILCGIVWAMAIYSNLLVG